MLFRHKKIILAMLALCLMCSLSANAVRQGKHVKWYADEVYKLTNHISEQLKNHSRKKGAIKYGEFTLHLMLSRNIEFNRQLEHCEKAYHARQEFMALEVAFNRAEIALQILLPSYYSSDEWQVIKLDMKLLSSYYSRD